MPKILKIKEFPQDYKAKIQLEDASKEVSKAFEDIVTWCIKGETKKMKDAMKKKIYQDLLKSKTSKDVETDFNIYEFASMSGNVEIMKIIHVDQKSKMTLIGRALAYAVLRDDLEMVKCILLNPNQSVKNSAKSWIYLSVARENIEITKELSKCFKNAKGKNILQHVECGFRKALKIAVKNQRLDLMKILINNYSHPGLPSRGLEEAVKTKKYEIVKYLIDNGASVFQTSHESYSYSYNTSGRKQSFIGLSKSVFGHEKKLDEDGRKELESIMNLISSKMKIMRGNVTDDHIALCNTYHLRHDFAILVTYILNGEVSKIEEEKHGIFLTKND